MVLKIGQDHDVEEANFVFAAIDRHIAYVQIAEPDDLNLLGIE